VLSRARGRLLAIGGALVLATLPAGQALGQSDPVQPGYDFYSLHALGDGVTVDFNLIGFLPIEDLVGLSSITSEAHFGTSRSDSLAALPDPGDLVLTLPGTLSALAGVSGLPDYPAAAHAEHPSTPVDDVQLVPDASLGAGGLHAEAAEAGASARAYVGNQVDTVGLLPGFSIGSVRTTATARRINEATYEATATSAVSDIRLLGGLLRISHLTSEVTVGVANDRPTASATKVDVSGVTVAGTPVGITGDGIVGLGQPLALAPVIDSLVRPLVGQGIKVHTTPSTTTLGDRAATANGGALTIEVPLDVQGYPGTLTVTLGGATASLEVGPLSSADDSDPTDDGDSALALGDDGLPLPGLGDSTSFDSLLPSTSATPTNGRAGAGTELVSVPIGRQIEDWDVTTLYRVLLLGGAALLAAGRVIVRTSIRPVRRATDLRKLWRW
jgi:hypothetical protein